MVDRKRHVLVVRLLEISYQPNLAEKIYLEFSERVRDLATSQELGLIVMVLDTNRRIADAYGVNRQFRNELIGLGVAAAFRELQIWQEATSVSLISGYSLREIFSNPVKYCVLANPMAFSSIPSISDRSGLFFFTGPGCLVRRNEKEEQHLQKIKEKTFNFSKFKVGKLTVVDAGPLIGLSKLVKIGKKLDGKQPWVRLVRLASRKLYDYLFSSTAWQANDFFPLRIRELAETLFDVGLDVPPEDLVFVLREDLEPTVE